MYKLYCMLASIGVASIVLASIVVASIGVASIGVACELHSVQRTQGTLHTLNYHFIDSGIPPINIV